MRYGWQGIGFGLVECGVHCRVLLKDSNTAPQPHKMLDGIVVGGACDSVGELVAQMPGQGA
ncbi:hypothetical protein [Streptomyces sp. NPDC020667]|uniref:hypothetical protein n=1 Tax=Streptomyces sp. NPDC020667 TaxID=3154895 RepID=UPI0033FB0EB1